MNDTINKESIRETLGISTATVNNWIKTGLIPPPDGTGGYTEETYNDIITSIRNNSSRLAGRANRSLVERKYICYLGITDKSRRLLLESLVDDFEHSGLALSEGVLALSISLLSSNGLLSPGWRFKPKTRIECQVTDWILQHQNHEDVILDLFSTQQVINLDDDFIGAFYQSIQSIAEKSKLGSYYTPSELLAGLSVPAGISVLDPCCGSGGILLRILGKNHDSSKVYARDIDRIALNICHVNLALFFKDPNFAAKIDFSDITDNKRSDLFSQREESAFDLIVTNPPWGSKFSKEKRDSLSLSFPELATTESFSIALHNSISILSAQGRLYFFLPHSFLNVAAHKNIRRKVLEGRGTVSVKLLGNAFKGVLSEGIVLEIDRSSASDEIHIVDGFAQHYSVPKSTIGPPHFLIEASATRRDADLLERIYQRQHTYLDATTNYALGIVTGDNGKHLLDHPTASSEPIYKGKNIEAFRYSEPDCFIEFNPDIYQQVAPLHYYRQPKIAYRFISDRIVCVLDRSNSLILNSANSLIPYRYPMETIVCLFNSPLYSFIYRKKFHSTKVLKSHLQALPLPTLSEDEHKLFKTYHERIVVNEWGAEMVDQAVFKIFGLTESEMDYIKGCVNGSS